MKNEIKLGYVKTAEGTILVQVPDDSRWGFYLADDEQSWPGGIGIASEWELVPEDEVPEADRERLRWIVEDNQ